MGIIRSGHGDDKHELSNIGERVPTVLAIGHDEPDVFYRRPTSFKMASKRWAQIPGDGWQFVASCCHRGHTALISVGLGATPLAVEPANASRPSGAACAQAFAKTAAVVRRGSTPQFGSLPASNQAKSATTVTPDVGNGLAISSIIFCSGVAMAFILFRRRLMRGSSSGKSLAGLQNVDRLPQTTTDSRRSASAFGSGIGGGLAWPGSRERLPLRM